MHQGLQGQGAEAGWRQQVRQQVHCEDSEAPRQCRGLRFFSCSVGHGGLYFLPKNTTMNALPDCAGRPLAAVHGDSRLHALYAGWRARHASKRIKAFLAQQTFEVVDWPGNSPDLNPIENCWNHMKTMLKKNDISFKTVCFKTIHYIAVHYKMVHFKTVKHYKMVRGSERYITKRYRYKTVHMIKWYTVTNQYVTKRYIIITVQYQN